MNNKEIMALVRQAKAQEELAKALKSGNAALELNRAREALEKAMGGAERLADSERILAAAEKVRDDAVRKGQAEVKAIDDMKAVASKEIQDARRRLANDEISAQHVADGLKKRAKKQGEVSAVLTRRETDVGAREDRADQREAQLATDEARMQTREAKVTRRENDVDARAKRMKEAAA